MSIYTKEFKEAISLLPSEEKDKLILRLLKKDLLLAKKLYFELVEGDIEARRTEMEKQIIERVKNLNSNFSSIGYLNMHVRYLSGDITQHVKITKDKYGEVSLNLLLLIEVLRKNREKILTGYPPVKQHKFTTSIIARTFKILLLINKMKEDLLLDFKEDLKTLGELIADNAVLMETAITNGLDVNWLIRAEIPEDIESIHKELKSLGFLK